MVKGELRTEETALAQERLPIDAKSASIFHVPSIEIGAVKLRPFLRTPAKPSKGNPTRKI